MNFINFGEGIKMMDIETGEVRNSTKQDVAETAVLVDALDNVDAYLQALAPRDVPPEVEDIHCMEAVFNNVTKPVFGGAVSGLGMRRIIQMGAIIAGGEEKLRERPFFCGGGCPVSPLQLSREISEVIIEVSRAGIPCMVLSMALSGSTAPVTLAGTLVVHNCEVLGGIILAQFTVISAISIRLMKSTFDNIDPKYEAVARTLRCNKFQAFFRVTLPLAKNGLIASIILSWARAVGEFGASVTLAGATRMKTETLPIAIYLSLSTADIEKTVAIVFILLLISVVVLFLIRRVGAREPFM